MALPFWSGQLWPWDLTVHHLQLSDLCILLTQLQYPASMFFLHPCIHLFLDQLMSLLLMGFIVAEFWNSAQPYPSRCHSHDLAWWKASHTLHYLSILISVPTQGVGGLSVQQHCTYNHKLLKLNAEREPKWLAKSNTAVIVRALYYFFLKMQVYPQNAYSKYQRGDQMSLLAEGGALWNGVLATNKNCNISVFLHFELKKVWFFSVSCCYIQFYNVNMEQ